VDVASLIDLSRATPLLRAVVQLLGVATIVYAMYRSEGTAGSHGGGTPPVETPSRRDEPTPGGEEDRNGAPAERDGEPK
jgi:hypothetical protein